MDFVHDRLANDRRFKCLTMADLCSKDVLVIEVDVSISGGRVCRILERLFIGRPWPEIVVLDNRPEFSVMVGMRERINTGCGCTSSNWGSWSTTRLLKVSMASFEMSA